MNRVWALGWVLAAGSGYLYANTSVTCYTNAIPSFSGSSAFYSPQTSGSTTVGNVTYGAGCATPGNFNYNDLMDWGLPTNQGGLGYATNQSGVNATTNNWDGHSLGNVAVDITSSDAPLYRDDSGYFVWDTSQNAWKIPSFDGLSSQSVLNGQFNAPSASNPSGGCSSPTSPAYPCQNPANLNIEALGDHLVVDPTGRTITITFPTGVSGVGFLISGTSNTNTFAEIEAYGKFDQPLQSYAIVDPAGGGSCNGEATMPPTPCNDAPFAAVSVNPNGSLIYAITITLPANATINGQTYNNATAGFAIDQLELETVPEPAEELTIGTGLALMAFLLRRKQRKPNAPKQG